MLVTHPGLQHSHQLAQALHERALLRAFWSGVPVRAPGEAPPWWLPASFHRQVREVQIPRELRRHPMRFQAALRVSNRLRLGQGMDMAHRVFHWYDAWAARQVLALRPKVVVAYENAAFHTFQAARSVGARCVLDAAAFHRLAAAELIGAPTTPYSPEIDRRKDEEVRLADLILTCSPLAADSYAAHGVPTAKLRPLLLGAQAPAELPAWQPGAGAPRFVFAGALSHRKSIDLIAAAFKRLHAEGLRYELLFIGGVAEPGQWDLVRSIPQAEHRPGVPQEQLYRVLAQSDCLLLPSRSDSFGMVVAEAMVCGTPAVVSTQTGAKAMIESHPGAGWIVEPDAESLYAMLRLLIRDPGLLRAAREPAARAGQSFSWAGYRQRAGQLLEEYVR